MVSRLAPVATFDAFTDALATTPPEGSMTVPEIWPVSTCAHAAPAVARVKIAAMNRLFISAEFVGFRIPRSPSKLYAKPYSYKLLINIGAYTWFFHFWNYEEGMSA